MLRDFKTFFVPDTRRGEYPPQAVVSHTKVIVNMVISDANKAFMVEHDGAIDALVAGLLVEESNPRRTQEGGEELQATCAMVLQNLALSDVGKVALRSHAGTMDGLRRLSSKEDSVGMTAEARQYASGALFELDELTRRRQRPTQSSTDGDGAETTSVVVEHVMLSYNWDHQSVIKRVNSALQARGYAVWIDIEKMQGSTVEVMSAAVEDAAVMCYGISQAYKESANCRLEAQYAYQRQKEMIPLMMEEGYRADGWLGMLLGVHLWYAFCGSVLASEASFEGKMEELCRELGEKGKAIVTDDSKMDNETCRELGQVSSLNVLDSASSVENLVEKLRCLDVNVLETTLEHALALLERLPASTPRKARKAARALCEKVDVAMDRAESQLMSEVVQREDLELYALGECLHAVQAVDLGSDAEECVEVVSALLAELEHCFDRTLGATQLLTSEFLEMRMRGLTVLSGLAREPLELFSTVEVLAADTVVGLLTGGGPSVAEQTLAWLALFAFGIRNEPKGSVSVFTSDAMATLLSKMPQLGAGRADDFEVTIVEGLRIGLVGAFALTWEMASKSPVGTVRQTIGEFWEKIIRLQIRNGFGSLTLDQVRCLSTVVTPQLAACDDVAVGVGLAIVLFFSFSYSPHATATATAADWEAQLHNAELIKNVLSLRDRIMSEVPSLHPPDQLWWVKCSEVMDCNAVYVGGIVTSLSVFSVALRSVCTPIPLDVVAQWHI
eukprot:COSAG02_NODE_9196_length_2292_cov_1.844961_1_plen_727_part_01